MREREGDRKRERDRERERERGRAREGERKRGDRDKKRIWRKGGDRERNYKCDVCRWGGVRKLGPKYVRLLWCG